MALVATEYVAKLPDGSWEPGLISLLEELSEAERLVFLSEVLRLREEARSQKWFWFDIAIKSLQSSDSFRALLKVGLARADASTIRDWLESFRLSVPELRNKTTLYVDGVPFMRGADFVPPEVR